MRILPPTSAFVPKFEYITNYSNKMYYAKNQSKSSVLVVQLVNTSPIQMRNLMLCFLAANFLNTWFPRTAVCSNLVFRAYIMSPVSAVLLLTYCSLLVSCVILWTVFFRFSIKFVQLFTYKSTHLFRPLPTHPVLTHVVVLICIADTVHWFLDLLNLASNPTFTGGRNVCVGEVPWWALILLYSFLLDLPFLPQDQWFLSWLNVCYRQSIFLSLSVLSVY